MDGFGDVELVHGGEDDGRRGQEKQHHGEREVDAQPLGPPADALDGEVLPTEQRARALEAALPGSGHQSCQETPWFSGGQKVPVRQAKGPA